MKKVKADGLADAVKACLDEYKTVSTEAVKGAVRKTAKQVKADIAANAPRRTGKYAKSWSQKVTKESASKLEMTVYSRNRYQLAHLLEKGHAKRGGGRVPGRPHIAPAEQKGIEQLETEIRRNLQHG